MDPKIFLSIVSCSLLCLLSADGTGTPPPIISDRRYSFNYPYAYPYGYRYNFDYYPVAPRPVLIRPTETIPTRTIPYDYGYYPYRYRYVHTADYDPGYRRMYSQDKSNKYPSNYPTGREYYPRGYQLPYPTGQEYYPRSYQQPYPTYGTPTYYYPPDPYGGKYYPRSYSGYYPYGYRYQTDPYYPSKPKQPTTYRRSYVETKVIGEETYPGRYLGPGKVNTLNGGRDVELVCQYATAANVVSNAVWTKIEGASNPYDNRPPYYCPDCQSSVLDFDDYRYSSQELPGSSVVLIRDVRPEDRGVYRCVGSAQVTPGGDTETVYRVINFFG